MLRLLTTATQHTGRAKEMSFIRRLIYHSRLILRNYPSFFGKNGEAGRLPGNNNNLLRIYGKAPRAAPGNVNNNGGFPRAGSAGGSSGSSTLLRIGQEIHSQVRKIFINNVLRRATTNQEVARKAAQRLLYGDSRPFFALVGVSLATGSAGIVTKESEFDGICWEIRESIAKKTKKLSEVDESVERSAASVSDITFGPIINQGCSAAVYAANWSNATCENNDWPLAVKMLFNYDIESNAFAILKGMVKEIVPARYIDLKNLYDLEQGIFANVKRCPPHENIIDVKHAFVDHVPLLPEGIERYPSALPRRLNPNEGFGRNMSLFLVMKRYDTTLQAYLNEHSDLKFRTRLLILTQILNGVAHLERTEIAHRDLKTDNILVDLSYGKDSPQVVISDFGCCLADKYHGLSLPFRTYDTDRGGNAALTAPEISTAVPGTWKYLNYKKSDAWTVGTIAYEIFGNPNPFYGRADSAESRLDSRTYLDTELPEFNGGNPIIQKLVKALLIRNPLRRMSAEEALNVCILNLWAPSNWFDRSVVNDDEILQWLLCLTTKSLCRGSEITRRGSEIARQKNSQMLSSDELEYKMIRTFLRKVKFALLKWGVRWIQSKN